MRFAKDEKKLIAYAKKKVVKYVKKQGPVIFAFVLSESGKIYDGVAFESTLSEANICAERHAIADMVLRETKASKIRSIFIAGPVSKSFEVVLPCGMCRHVINEFSTAKTTVICSGFIITDKGKIIMSEVKKYKIESLYPHPYKESC